MLTVNLEKFKAITLEETLNYIPFEELEKSVFSTANSVLTDFSNKYKAKKLSLNEKMDYYLKKCLLSVSGNQTWQKIKKENNLDSDYLYIVLKKYYLRLTDEIGFINK